MSKRDKLLRKALASPGGLTFRELIRLAEGFDFEVRSGKGSHRILVRDDLRRSIPIQSAGGKALAYQVRQVLDALRELGLISD
jgi:hypothetical protein